MKHKIRFWMIWLARRGILGRCPDCGKLEYLFGFAVGRHRDCIPF